MLGVRLWVLVATLTFTLVSSTDELLPKTRQVFADLENRIAHLHQKQGLRDLEIEDDMGASSSGGFSGSSSATSGDENSRPTPATILWNAGVGAAAGYLAHRLGGVQMKDASEIFFSSPNEGKTSLCLFLSPSFGFFLYLSLKFY